ncbi:MAG: ATP-binding protein [Bacteroidota bacterium]|jgi:serine/threonine-protein kinase RsbW
MNLNFEMVQEQKISFASTPENITLVEKLVNDLCANSSISEDYYGNILVALTEAVNNAIQHGNKLDAAKAVDVGWTTENDRLKVTVSDHGPGFDFSNLPDPTNPENLEKPNGRGVFLMRNLADNIEFFDEGRTVQLEFNLKA